MKFVFSPRQVFFLCCAIIVSTISIIAVYQLTISFSNGGGDWVSAIIQASGNIIGGIIGGIVAFIAASYQIGRMVANEKRNQIAGELIVLKLLREELHSNCTVLKKSIPFKSEEIKILHTQLCDEVWKTTMSRISLPDELLIRFNTCYRLILLIKSAPADEINDELLEKAKGKISNLIELIEAEIKKVSESLDKI